MSASPECLQLSLCTNNHVQITLLIGNVQQQLHINLSVQIFYSIGNVLPRTPRIIIKQLSLIINTQLYGQSIVIAHTNIEVISHFRWYFLQFCHLTSQPIISLHLTKHVFLQLCHGYEGHNCKVLVYTSGSQTPKLIYPEMYHGLLC